MVVGVGKRMHCVSMVEVVDSKVNSLVDGELFIVVSSVVSMIMRLISKVFHLVELAMPLSGFLDLNHSLMCQYLSFILSFSMLAYMVRLRFANHMHLHSHSHKMNYAMVFPLVSSQMYHTHCNSSIS